MSKLEKEGTKLAFFKILSWIRGQNDNSSHLLQISKEKKKRRETGEEDAVAGCDFSLKYQAIRPSAIVGTRREAALRREGFVWVPDLRSFDKLYEVGDLSYLVFTLYLSVL